jgi:methionyl-tRNA formyltransferase
MLNIGFLGTPQISAYVMEQLHKNGFNIKWILTQPDKKAGRGLKLVEPAVKTKAKELGINVFQADKFTRDLGDELLKQDVDLCVVVAYGAYIPSYFVSALKRVPLNIHVSLLPLYRGAAPVARAIMNGDSFTGVSIMQIAKEMDAGDVVVQKKINIEDNDDTSTLTQKLIESGTKLLLDIIPDYIEGKIKCLPQASLGVHPTYAEKIFSKERDIDWSKPVKSIHDKVRALYPWPVAQAKINDIDIKIIKTKYEVSSSTNRLNGEIFDILKKEGLIKVAGADGFVLVEKVQPFGKREMNIQEFLNGYKIEKGMRFKNV